MGRLYFRIYLAVIGSLLVFALLAGLAAMLIRALDDEDGRAPWPEMGAAIVARLLPADRNPAALAKDLAFWHESTGFSLMLISPEGEVIAQAGDIPQRTLRRLAPGEDDAVWRQRGRVSAVTLPDGRRIIAVSPRAAMRWVRHWRWLAALLGIGLAVALCAYPVVRQLTRKLERLQQGVAAFGAGDLSARVEVSGRDEVAKLAETFNASAARIERLMEAHKTLLANASHELRSPLARLRMAIEGIEAGGAPAVAARAEIARNIEELDALVEEVLLASRLDAGGAQELKREPVDLVGLVAEECAAFGVDFSAEGAPLPQISADARLLRRLFRNLLENALRHGGGEPVSVTARRSGADALVAVCDRGPGVPEAERERIFEPFYRPRHVPESAGGAGLGLALVRQIATRHGGHVGCLPNPEGGACFHVRLPLTA